MERIYSVRIEIRIDDPKGVLNGIEEALGPDVEDDDVRVSIDKQQNVVITLEGDDLGKILAVTGTLNRLLKVYMNISKLAASEEGKD